MARVVITLKIMPEDPSTDLVMVENSVKKEIIGFAGNTEIRAAHEPIAFGIVALKITFVSDEAKGDTEQLEKKISAIEGVNSVDVIDVRRAVG